MFSSMSSAAALQKLQRNPQAIHNKVCRSIAGRLEAPEVAERCDSEASAGKSSTWQAPSSLHVSKLSQRLLLQPLSGGFTLHSPLPDTHRTAGHSRLSLKSFSSSSKRESLERTVDHHLHQCSPCSQNQAISAHCFSSWNSFLKNRYPSWRMFLTPSRLYRLYICQYTP